MRTIPSLVVPLLLITHVAALSLLLRRHVPGQLRVLCAKSLIRWSRFERAPAPRWRHSRWAWPSLPTTPKA